MEEGRDKSQTDLQLRRLSLIDFSSENDALVFSTSSPLQGQIAETDMQQGLFESFGDSFGSGKEMDLSLTPDGGEEDQCPDLKKSSEPDRFSWKGKCNLRKSLAWDSAFFTSAGVLDAEELSCMIKGAENSEKTLLPGIEEDIRESSDSLSTLESDNLALENLEAELFQDIRASIQRSSKSFAATSEQANSVGSKMISSKKKMNLSSQNQKPTPDLKKPTGASKPPARQTLGAQGIAKSVNQDARRPKVEQAVRPGNSNSTLKPPRVISMFKPTTIPTAKRASFAASDVNKTGHQNMTTGSAAGKLPPAPKAPVVSGARRVLPRPTLPSRTSSFGSSNSTKSASSSLDSSGSVSTEKIRKSNLVPAQRKVGSKTANPPPASSSSLKTPSKSASRNTTTSRNSAVSAYLMSSKISSSMSPASSNNELSSASSSSSVTFNLGSKSRTSFDTSSCRSSQNDSMTSDWNGHNSSQVLDKGENERMTVPSRSARKSSTQTATLSSSDSARPSGLRLPSPKIGFFDGAKSVRTPNGSRQSQSNPAMLTKTGSAVPSPRRGSSVKPKIAKTSHAKAVSALPKVNPQELTSPMLIEKAQTPQEHDHSDMSDVHGHSISSSLDHKFDKESCEKVEEVGGEVPDQANHAESARIGVVINIDLPLIRKSETNPDVNGAVSPKGNKAVAIDDLQGCDSEKREILKSWEKVDEVDKAIGGVSLVDAAISSKDNMVVVIGDSSNSEKREISKPWENVNGPENFGMASVMSIAEKENVVLREHVDEFGNILGHQMRISSVCGADSGSVSLTKT